jgi:hypothetical protein
MAQVSRGAASQVMVAALLAEQQTSRRRVLASAKSCAA